MSLRDWRQALNSSPTYKISNGTLRFQTKFVTLITTVGLIVLFFTYNEYHGRMSILPSVENRFAEYNKTYPLTTPKIVANGIEFRIGIVADLDIYSKSNSNMNVWVSYFLKGKFIWNSEHKTVNIYWDKIPISLKSSYNLAGRGMELSELTVFDGRLLTFDDRTGIIYEIKDDSVNPWIILVDANGISSKGFKSEWATVKGNSLYVGSMGKEWTTSNGEFVNHNPMWVKLVYPSGEVKHLNWEQNYKKLREAVNIDFPGYMIHESGIWSSVHNKWFFLPRRSSRSQYDEVVDEHKATNILLIADENFKKITVKYIGGIIPIRGFSSFKFVPSSNDYVIAALKSEEYNGTSSTYITAFTIDGEILLPDKKISNLKYEGIEFI